MKHAACFLLMILLATGKARGQGTFVYDQQSAVEGTGGNPAIIQGLEPFGQFFTPTLSSVGFIRLFLQDGNAGNGLGATVSLNLRSSSITGSVLSSTEPVFMADGYGLGPHPYNGYTDLFFATPVEVTPGTTYFFDVNVLSGDSWRLISYSYGYSGGVEYAQGGPVISGDLWFREGIVAVPEPTTTWLVLTGATALFFCAAEDLQLRCKSHRPDFQWELPGFQRFLARQLD